MFSGLEHWLSQRGEHRQISILVRESGRAKRIAMNHSWKRRRLVRVCVWFRPWLKREWPATELNNISVTLYHSQPDRGTFTVSPFKFTSQPGIHKTCKTLSKHKANVRGSRLHPYGRHTLYCSQLTAWHADEKLIEPFLRLVVCTVERNFMNFNENIYSLTCKVVSGVKVRSKWSRS